MLPQNTLVKYLQAYVFILIMSIVNGEGCPQSIPTITFVHSCPKNITEIIKAKERKQCYLISQNCTTPDKFEYHCLPNKYINKFVEVCASKTVIVGQHCAYYDTESNFIRPNFHQPCEKHMNPCPDVYISSSTFTYQECYEDNRSGRTFNIIPNPPMLMQNDDKLLNYITTVICAVVLVLSLSVLLLQIVCLRRCYLHFKCFLKKMQKRKHARKMEEDEESDESLEGISLMLSEVGPDLERTDESNYYPKKN